VRLVLLAWVVHLRRLRAPVVRLLETVVLALWLVVRVLPVTVQVASAR
jgi:hypothetical protein